MPAVFLGHGSPMNTLESNTHTQAWRAFGAGVATKPKAILCVSAHWVTRGVAVTAMEKPRTIHDFGGFPKPLLEFQYPAAGAPWLAKRVGELLAPETQVIQDTSHWGLDHGTWSVLAHVYPKADVPVVQLSLNAEFSDAQHYALAKRLRPLLDEGVMIVASGNVVHNLGRIQWRTSGGASGYDWAQRFNEFVTNKLQAHDHVPLIDWQLQGDDAQLSVPTPEHYWPMLYVLAQQPEGGATHVITNGVEMGGISMLSFSV